MSRRAPHTLAFITKCSLKLFNANDKLQREHSWAWLDAYLCNVTCRGDSAIEVLSTQSPSSTLDVSNETQRTTSNIFGIASATAFNDVIAAMARCNRNMFSDFSIELCKLNVFRNCVGLFSLIRKLQRLSIGQRTHAIESNQLVGTRFSPHFSPSFSHSHSPIDTYSNRLLVRPCSRPERG